MTMPLDKLGSCRSAIAGLMLLATIADAQQQPPQRRPPPPPSAPPPATQPAAPPKPPAPEPEAQILGLPRVGEEGATADDVDVLQRAARKFLADGRCKRIDYGDRSMSRMGWYIISCDGHNIGFRREDIEN